MRDIRFRAWSDSGFFISEEEQVFIDANGNIWSQDMEIREDWTINMSTGLKDKNGKEIYEGDILQRKYDRYLYSVHYGTTAFGVNMHREDGIFSSSWEYNSSGNEVGEIIGNIYENPTLLPLV